MRECLRRLDVLDVTKTTIQQTRVSVDVRGLLRDSSTSLGDDPEIKMLSKRLIQRWKRLFGKSAPLEPAITRNSGNMRESRETMELRLKVLGVISDTLMKGARHESSGVSREEGCDDREGDDDKTSSGLQPMKKRRTSGPDTTEQTKKITDEYCHGLAQEIERAVYVSQQNDEKGYRSKVRSLIFNLKRSDNELWRKVIMGHVDAKQLAQMDADSLDLNIGAKRKAIRQRSLDQVADWSTALGNNTDLECPRCGYDRTYVSCVGLRGGWVSTDLEQNTLATCCKCQHRWEF